MVTNSPPVGTHNPSTSDQIIHLFREGAGAPGALPFEHQHQAFQAILNNQELLLVAGTASGKTLALGVPLFHKLQQGHIRKVLLMYPTVALLEDQRQVMERLAQAAGLSGEIGQLQGGMSRSALMHNLNKRLLLATPDEIYWFFRKNVKYNALLLYGLCLVDEFVLDEAHLFNGLMLRNFEHLWNRVKTLAGYLGRTPRLHILTATPTHELMQLTGAKIIEGESKSFDVNVEFRVRAPFEFDRQFENAINEMLQAGKRKVLVVCNSARMAHQLFLKYKVDETRALSVEHRYRFGTIMRGALTPYLEKAGITAEMLSELNKRLSQERDLALAELPKGTELNLSLQDVVRHLTDILERQCWRVKRALRERSRRPEETWEAILNNRALPCRVVAAVRKRLEHTADIETQQAIVDEWRGDTIDRVGNLSDDSIRCKAGDFGALTAALVSAGLDATLASLITKRLTVEMKADPHQLPAQISSQAALYLRWLDWIVKDDEGDKLRQVIKAGLASRELEVECKHIGVWRGADVPVIVYSGSMTKVAREGLIKVFSDLDRAVLISTSAVEVGVDFDAEVLISEECEGNSFLQRFGRVGRHSRESQVIAFVSGETYAALNRLDRSALSREEFTAKVREVFPRRNYAVGSDLLDASHYLINEQLGRIGERLNGVPDFAKAKHIAQQLRTADIQLGFGLRSTIPQITLRDGVSKDSFYLLRYVDDTDLSPSDSPFEVARAKKWFNSLIFQPKRFDVVVHLSETLKASQHVLLLMEGQFYPWSRIGVGYEYLREMNAHFARGHGGGWNKWDQRNFLLLHGDVYLSWIEREVHVIEPVRDIEQNPLFIPNQTYLVLWGWTEEQSVRELLQDAKVADWEELHYDWERLQQHPAPKAMVILENTTGACFAAYKELVEYARRQIQK